jgi:hypothetical protein
MEEEGEVGAAAHRSNPRAAAVDVRGGSVGTFVDTMIEYV